MALINRESLLEKIQFRIEPQGIVGETVKDMVEKTREIIMDEPTVDAVSRGVLDQVRWERDVAIEQLESYGVSFGEKADVTKVVHGHWISLTDCANAGVYCSVCGKKVWKEDYAWCNKKNRLRSPYCPNCGADMR